MGLLNGPKLQIYQCRLHEGQIHTSCIVLSCARKDINIVQEQFMNYKAHDLGKEVEFIAYQMPLIWSHKQYAKII